MKVSLKPCPFCGGEAKLKINPTTLNTSAECPKCNVTMKQSFKGHSRINDLLEELIAEAWNRRICDE